MECSNKADSGTLFYIPLIQITSKLLLRKLPYIPFFPFFKNSFIFSFFQTCFSFTSSIILISMIFFMFLSFVVILFSLFWYKGITLKWPFHIFLFNIFLFYFLFRSYSHVFLHIFYLFLWICFLLFWFWIHFIFFSIIRLSLL